MTHNPYVAAAYAVDLPHDQLAHELTLAACPSHPITETLRSALMIEAAARLEFLRADQRPEDAPNPVWLDRYEQARAAENVDAGHDDIRTDDRGEILPPGILAHCGKMAEHPVHRWAPDEVSVHDDYTMHTCSGRSADVETDALGRWSTLVERGGR